MRTKAQLNKVESENINVYQMWKNLADQRTEAEIGGKKHKTVEYNNY